MNELRCYFDISIDGKNLGRVQFKLNHKECPKTCENFRALCTGEKGISRTSGGDITEGNGKGGDSIYNGSFEDETLAVTHDQPYLLSMANRGPDTNRSQFFITISPAVHLDGKHVVFGKVISGIDVINKIERLDVDSKFRPLKDVIVTDCGQLSSNIKELKRNEDDIDLPQKGEKRKLSRSASPSSRDSKEIIRSSRRPLSSSSSCSHSTCSSLSQPSSSRLPSKYRDGRRYSRSSSRSSASGSSSSGSGSSSSSSTSGSSGDSDSDTESSRTGSGSSDTGSSSNASGSSTASSKRSPDAKTGLTGGSPSSDSSCSSSSSNIRGNRKRQKVNRRLTQTRPTTASKFTAPKAFERKSDLADSFVSPHYRCSVKLDEIPEVPANRFLMREPSNNRNRPEDNEDLHDDHEVPIEVDLSKFEDIPEDGDGEFSSKEPSVLPKSSTALKSQIKPTEPQVSRSGRIMKGRGTFRFRTPSPDEIIRRRSPIERKRKDYDDERRKRRYEHRSRSRSRTRDRSSHHRSSRYHDHDDRL